MHVVIITASLGAGGAQRVIAQLAKEWASKDIVCDIILLLKAERFYTVPDNVTIHEIGRLSSNPALDKLKKYMTVRRIVKNLNPNIVLSLPEEIGIYVIPSLLGLKIPIVVSERNNPWVMPYKKITRALRLLLYPLADGFIFQTEKAASFFSDRIQNKGAILYNPLDLERLPEPYHGSKEKIIVSVGRLEKQKNFKLLINAFAIFQKTHSDYKLVIYGDGTEKNSLSAYAESKLNKDSWALPGKDKDVLEKIKKAACFVLSSDYEGVPNALIEAMTIGVPCVSTDCAPGGAASIIDNNKNGFLVPVGDEIGLAEKIGTIVDSPPTANSFSNEAIKLRQKLDSRKVCEDWLDYLRKVAGNS